MRQYHLKLFAALSKMLLCHFHRNIIMIKWIDWIEEQCTFECIRLGIICSFYLSRGRNVICTTQLWACNWNGKLGRVKSSFSFEKAFHNRNFKSAYILCLPTFFFFESFWFSYSTDIYFSKYTIGGMLIFYTRRH